MNKNPACPKCKSEQTVKNGKVLEKQRYKCKHCNFQFTRLTTRGVPAADKARAIQLYLLGLSMTVIAKLYKVSTPAVLKWIKTFAKENCEKPAADDAILIELDEMCHYLGLKKTKFGYGKPTREKQVNLLTGNAENETKKLS